MSRINKVIKNTTASYVQQMLTGVLGFITRTVFIKQLGATYLGVNGLFTNILGLLSLAEFGFGTAMNYEMYKPIANKDYKKVNTLISIYKRVYHSIAVFILIVGLLIVPFLKYLIKGSIIIENVYVYYILYLINTVASYYSSYLYCITNAEQKVYISSIISTIFVIIIFIFHLFVLIVMKSFLFYLITSTCMVIVQQIVIKIYFKKNYDYIFSLEKSDLDIETKQHIKKNLGGLIVSKIADVLTHQTDNVIIATGLNIVTVGYADNYMIIITYLKKIILNLMTSVVPSMGNMIATESKEKCYQVFKIYDIFDFFIYSFFTICLISLYQPFIILWIGKDKIIDYWSMLAMSISFYLSGRNHAFLNYKTAAGIFYDIKITSIVSVIINLVLSVIGVIKFGLLGVYIGTCASLLYSNIRNLRLSYYYLTGNNVIKYYVKRIIQVLFTIIPIVFLNIINIYFLPEQSWINFIKYSFVVFIFSFVWLFATNCFYEEFKELIVIIKESLLKIKCFRRRT